VNEGVEIECCGEEWGIKVAAMRVILGKFQGMRLLSWNMGDLEVG
jgi:hypothetical protein